MSIGTLSSSHVATGSSVCRTLDPLFRPAEKRLPVVTTAFELRAGALAMGCVTTAVFVLEGVRSLWALLEIPHGGMAGKSLGGMVSLVQLAVGGAFAHRAWHTYHRKADSARCLARLAMAAALCVLLLLLSMPIWVGWLCRSEETQHDAADGYTCHLKSLAECHSRVVHLHQGLAFPQCSLTTNGGSCTENPQLKAARAELDGEPGHRTKQNRAMRANVSSSCVLK